MFTGESSFTVRPTKNRLGVRRHRGQRLDASEGSTVGVSLRLVKPVTEELVVGVVYID